ncbi:MAG: serine acetyltransferase [Planctomycetaceae bacterium]|jgi:serine O-acetyltransferase|nr:serine acetyltransferase [Planctomycetaceae bacterium]
MLAKFLVLPFGNPWKLKSLCISTKNLRLRKLLILLWDTYQYENNSSIAWNSTFYGEPCFPHGMKSIFVSSGAIVGRNCVIFQQVTIGSNTLVDSKGAGFPVIGHDCYIGAGAKIIGNVKVGNLVRIGANSVVYKDVPNECVVTAGEQVTLPKHKSMDNRFYHSCKGSWMYYQDSQWIAVDDLEIKAILEKKLAKRNRKSID